MAMHMYNRSVCTAALLLNPSCLISALGSLAEGAIREAGLRYIPIVPFPAILGPLQVHSTSNASMAASHTCPHCPTMSALH